MKIIRDNLFSIKISSAILLLVAIISCHRDNNHPGYAYLPDMEESRAYESYSENPIFEDGKTMQPPAEGTIARGDIPYPYIKDDNDLLLAGRHLSNPLRYSTENKDRGELLYTRFCTNCHGDLGDGKGYLYASGRFPLPPANLTQEKTINRPDGEIYHIITVGYGIMGAHGSQIKQEDRWKIIMYVRNELQK